MREMIINPWLELTFLMVNKSLEKDNKKWSNCGQDDSNGGSFAML